MKICLQRQIQRAYCTLETLTHRFQFLARPPPLSTNSSSLCRKPKAFSSVKTQKKAVIETPSGVTATFPISSSNLYHSVFMICGTLSQKAIPHFHR
ncbi:hypothetical protein NPIL_547381 [Nephila pilipes]|uniref:Uncharacterized protein n=1 Tax=Nephila pilipes TaxID=299642 RepID=A0A8X6TMQ8_NEPPI|nr:hypothetical protein NPIL_547381 [Nephila pilipes]